MIPTSVRLDRNHIPDVRMITSLPPHFLVLIMHPHLKLMKLRVLCVLKLTRY